MSNLYTKLLLCYKHQWVLIGSVGIWICGGVQVQAQTENSVFPPLPRNRNSQSDLMKQFTQVAKLGNFQVDSLKQVTPVAKLDNFQVDSLTQPTPVRKVNTFSVDSRKQVTSIAKLNNFSVDSSKRITPITDLNKFQVDAYNSLSAASVSLRYPLKQPVLISAAPENFNPGRRLPVAPLPETPTPPVPNPPAPVSPAARLENLQTNFRDEKDNFRQHNQFVEPTAQFLLPNGQRLRFKVGVDRFEKAGFNSVTNIPLQIGWEGKLGKYTLRVDGGVDLFNRLPTALNLNTRLDIPIYTNLTSDYQLSSGLFLAGIFEHGPFKSNAQTLDRRITASRFGPDLYWQINSKSSFFTTYRYGFYNDSNREQQSFSRLERKIGSFFLALNLFTWSYKSDRQRRNGYFSPPDFLDYNGEIGWEGDVSKFLRCRLNVNLGQQRLRGKFDQGNGYQTRCTVKLSPKLELDLGYAFSNVRNLDTGNNAYNNRTFTSQLRVNF